ncbi:MAG: hypothetical protein R2864_06950 [Syntrophotaleaceae bacterium]
MISSRWWIGGSFREDLYYRLNGISFELPPLRERSDIALLINDVMVIEAGNQAQKVTIAEDAMRVMIDFPGQAIFGNFAT